MTEKIAHIPNLAAFDKLVLTLETLDNSPDSDLGFDMYYGISDAAETDHQCGTAACIGGFAAYILNPDYLNHDSALLPADALIKLTGIENRDAFEICYPTSFDPEMRRHFVQPDPYEATPKQAVSLLKHYRATAFVDWDLAMESKS